MVSAREKIRLGLGLKKNGLPPEAFALVGEALEPETWKLPHHSQAIFRAMAGKLSLESAVDWDRMPAAVAAISAEGYRGRRVEATPAQIVEAARHLAEHYRRAGKSLPDTLERLLS